MAEDLCELCEKPVKPDQLHGFQVANGSVIGICAACWMELFGE